MTQEIKPISQVDDIGYGLEDIKKFQVKSNATVQLQVLDQLYDTMLAAQNAYNEAVKVFDRS